MILLTGAGGFIGSNILEKISKWDEEIVIIDNFLDNKKWDFISKDSFKIHFNISDLENALKLDYSLIIHIGAITDTTEDDDEKLNLYNLEYSKKIWKYCVENNAKLIYASSAATYGDGSNGFMDDHNTINNLKPLNKYGLSKHNFDVWCLSQENSPSSWYGLKFFNVYGKNENNKGAMASVVHWGTRFIKENGYINLFKSNDPKIKNGRQKRDFIFCNDIASVVNFLKEKKVESGIYNIGSGKLTNVGSIYNQIHSLMEQDSSSMLDIHGVVNDGDICPADISKTISTLNWKPCYDIRSALSRTIKMLGY